MAEISKLVSLNSLGNVYLGMSSLSLMKIETQLQ